MQILFDKILGRKTKKIGRHFNVNVSRVLQDDRNRFYYRHRRGLHTAMAITVNVGEKWVASYSATLPGPYIGQQYDFFDIALDNGDDLQASLLDASMSQVNTTSIYDCTTVSGCVGFLGLIIYDPSSVTLNGYLQVMATVGAIEISSAQLRFTNVLGDSEIVSLGEFQKIGVVPIPAALPLFVTALVGMGFVGWYRKKFPAA